MALYDSSQEGANMLNTTFNGYDDTIKAQSIQAIQMAIEAIEMNASSITGVFQEEYGSNNYGGTFIFPGIMMRKLQKRL